MQRDFIFSPIEPIRRRRLFPAFLFFVFVAGAIFIVDQGLKRWCTTSLRVLETRPLIAGVKQLLLSRIPNRGVLADAVSTAPFMRFVPIGIWALMLVIALARFRKAGTFERVALALLLAGGASNLLDRWRSDYVTHTLQLCACGQRCLSFNVADVAIVVGALATILCFAFAYRRPARLFS